MEMHALIEEIAALLVKIKSGEATSGELETFVTATNQLNERAIILRYKAYEAQIYGSPVAEQPALETPVAVAVEPVVESEEFVPEFESNQNQEEEPSYDLFALDTEEEEDEPIAFELIEEPVEEIREEEPIEEVIEPVYQEEEKAPVVTEPAFAAPIENTQGLHAIYKKLNSNDGTLAARLMSVRLDTLKGAFGFNERLQIIQELFNGSNEEFNNLIEELETIASKDQARSLVSGYANKYQWDVDSQLAIELVQKVERKYA